MRFLLTINQKKAQDWGLNLNESIIFSVIYESPNWAKEIIIDGKAFYFISRQTICKELPLIDFKPDTVYRYIKKLQDKGLIEWRKDFKKDCIRLTSKGREWNATKSLGSSSDTSDTHPSKVGQSSGHSDSHPKKLGCSSENNSDGHPTYPSTIIDPDTNDQKKEDVVFSNDPPPETKNSIPKDPDEKEKKDCAEKKEKPDPVYDKQKVFELARSEIIKYLNQKTGKNFKPNTRQTAKFINGRLNDGYTVPDFRTVIDRKCHQWGNDPKMDAYLRPNTLFRPGNFENYLNEKDIRNDKSKSKNIQRPKTSDATPYREAAKRGIRNLA